MSAPGLPERNPKQRSLASVGQLFVLLPLYSYQRQKSIFSTFLFVDFRYVFVGHVGVLLKRQLDNLRRCVAPTARSIGQAS